MILETDILAQDFGDNMTTIHITKKIEEEFKHPGENEYPH